MNKGLRASGCLDVPIHLGNVTLGNTPSFISLSLSSSSHAACLNTPSKRAKCCVYPSLLQLTALTATISPIQIHPTTSSLPAGIILETLVANQDMIHKQADAIDAAPTEA